MKNKLAQIKLADIEISETNKMFRDESDLTDEALKELIDSVKQHGVIQPIILRFNPTNKGKAFILIAGERRFRASIAAKTVDIPAYVMEITDEQAFDLQITENLQRKDVHPLKEAHAYKYMMEKDPKNTVAELALRFGKTEHYVLTRIKLNALIPRAEKDYHDGVMSLGHALLIARLTPEDQKSTIESCSGSFRNGKELVRYYESIQQLEDHIDTSVICNLSSAAFKKDDATLIPKAGACTVCPQRSGASQLFSDITQKDRCFNPACFLAKRMKFMAAQIPELLEKQPDLLFLHTGDGRDKVDPDVQKVLTDNKVKILSKSRDFYTYSWDSRAKAKGIWINGDEVGIQTTVFLDKVKSTGTKTNDHDQVDAKVAIANIKERTERAAELDNEKVYVHVLELLKTHKEFSEEGKLKPMPVDKLMMRFMILEHENYTLRDQIEKRYKLNRVQKPGTYLDKLAELSDQDFTNISRMIMLEKFSGQAPTVRFPAGQLIMRAASDIGLKTQIAELTAAQKTIRDKREERAAERIRALKPAKQNKKVKKAKKEKVVAAGKRTIKSKPKKEAVAEDGPAADTTASHLPQLF